MNKSVGVIVNAVSGTAQTEQKITLLRQAFASHSLEPEFFLVHPGLTVAEVTQKALASGPAIIAAGGGDGTINSVASQLLNTEVALGILPLGTHNHLAQDLGIPLELEEAVRTLARGREKYIDIAQVNDRLFLNNSSIGFYSKLIGFRDDHRESGWSKTIATARAIFDVVFNYSFLNVEIEVNGVRQLHKTPLVFVGNNEYAVNGFNIGRRRSLSSGKLYIYVIKYRGKMDLIKLGIYALLQRLKSHDQFSYYVTTSMELENRKHSLRVAVDGEIINLAPPLKYSIIPSALKVMVP